MKKRLGYVSNSSSSSFIMFGVQADLPEGMEWEDIENNGLDLHENGDVVYVGVDLGRFDEYDGIETTPLDSKLEKVHRLLEEVGIPHDKLDVIYGTEYN